MKDSGQDLLKHLTLERIEENHYRGESRDVGSSSVFGGQVLGQALFAASQTVEGRDVHSLHGYFSVLVIKISPSITKLIEFGTGKASPPEGL